MAQKDLDDLADILLKNLHKSSEVFRELVTSKEIHAFTIDELEIRKKVRQEVRSIINIDSNAKLPTTFENALVREVPKMVEKFRRLFLSAMNSSKSYNIKVLERAGAKSFTIIIESKTGRGKVFNYFRRVKQLAQKNLVIAIDDVIKNRELGEKRLTTGVGKNRSASGAFLDIGHDDETTNASFRSQRAEEILLQFTNNRSNPAVNAYVAEVFDSVFVRVTKGPTKKDGKTVFAASLDASSKNRGKALIDADKAGFLQKALDRMVADQVKMFPNAKGSDSPVEVIEKRVTNILAGAGNSKSTLKKQKINTRPGKGTSKPRKVKTTVAPRIKERKTRLNPKRQSSSDAGRRSLQQLIGPLNEQINRRVKSNMEAPGLENRTGRFAGSVRVTDITTTPQGYPSIGYTYQRRPYDKFEKDPERDPRKVIDQSMREIAAQYAIGRFYTRRI